MLQQSLFETLDEGEMAPSTRRNCPTGARAKCVECGSLFTPNPSREGHVHCSPKCRTAASDRRKAERAKREDAKGVRDEGMSSAARHYRHELETARRVALQAFASRGGIGIVSHVRDECDRLNIDLDWGANWPGSLFHASPWFEATGRRLTSFHPSSNARKVNEYRLSAAGWAALKEAGCRR